MNTDAEKTEMVWFVRDVNRECGHKPTVSSTLTPHAIRCLDCDAVRLQCVVQGTARVAGNARIVLAGPNGVEKL